MGRRAAKRGQKSKRTPAYLPGDLEPAASVQRMIRVDHAGEYGAARIYEGQLAVLRPGPRCGCGEGDGGAREAPSCKV